MDTHKLSLADDALAAGKHAKVRRMKWLASSMLLAMLGLLALSAAYRDAHPWLGWVHAFAEAAAVGAIADWFAVTALFRHPLGLPIPHGEARGQGSPAPADPPTPRVDPPRR